jgi:hypothetical protein
MPEGFQTNIPAAVKHALGADLKLIVVLRHPVKRAVSAYLHYLNEGELAASATFEQSMKYIGVIDMGFYARHLEAWLGEYDLCQIKVLTLENDIQAQPESTLSRLCDFLDLNHHRFEPEDLEKVVYAGIPKRIDQDGVFADLEDLHSRLGLESHHNGDGYTQILDAGQWRQLELMYRDDVAHLDTLLGTRLLTDWGFPD